MEDGRTCGVCVPGLEKALHQMGRITTGKTACQKRKKGHDTNVFVPGLMVN